jgi:MFS family permease
MVGTAFSGLLVAVFGVPLIVIINGLSNLYSAFSELFIHVPRTVQQGEKVSAKSILRDSKAAVKTILKDHALQLFVPCALIINLLAAGPLTLILPFCLEKGFTVDMYGYLMAVWTAASLVCVLLLGIIKLSQRARFWVLAAGFIGSAVFFLFAYNATAFIPLCVMAFLASFTNCAGNAVFNASLMLALPEENRGAILGFIQSASVGGSALSAVIYGFLGDIFPLYLVFTVGCALSLAPMLYLCLHPKTKQFILEH